MSKSAWLITHDQYIDRRIFFFADVLRANGYEVKLFPEYYYSPMTSEDPDYVYRPEHIGVVRGYYGSGTSIPDKIRECFETVIASEERYFVQHHSFTCDNDSITIPDNIKIYTDNDKYVIKYEDNELTIRYYSDRGAYSLVNTRSASYDIKVCEKDIIDVLSGEIVVLPEQTVVSPNQVELQIKTDTNGHRIIYAHLQMSNSLYAYDIEEETLTEYMPLDDIGEVSVSIPEEYEEFRAHIYDFSNILKRVNSELMTQTPDLVYVADLPTLPIGVLLKEKYGCRLIMDCHEWWYKNCELWPNGDPLNAECSDKFEKELYPKCDMLITVGEHIAYKMHEHIGCDFEVVYSCLSRELEERMQDNTDVIRQKNNLDADSKIVIFQGSMSPHRNLENLARATKYLPDDCYLYLLSAGDYQDVFKKVLKKEGNPDRVIWGGWVSQAELMNYTKSADLGVIPYTAVNDYAECFVPNKMVEYYSAQLPVLYDESLCELSRVIGGNEVGYGTDLTDPENFGKAIVYLLKESDKLAEYRNNYSLRDKMFNYAYQSKNLEIMLEKYGMI